MNSLISKYLKTEQEKQKFADFVLNKTKMVVTNVPAETDLNKLFETLNNRGVQLSQHEILKANLLSKIKNKETRYLYNALWSACSDMYDYIERNLAREVGKAKEVASTYGWNKVENEWRQSHDWNAVKDLIKRNKHEKNKLLNLKDILHRNKDFELENNSNGLDLFHPNASADEYEKVRSILTFPQLLLHTLRIYLYKNGRRDIQRINEKELIDIFNKYFFTEKVESEQQEASKEFIELLIKVREVFDKYVIKWVEESENTETHLIKVVKKQNQQKRGRTYYLRRQKNKEHDGLALLQSILYHSQQNTTQYWLTPFLYYVLDYPEFEMAYINLKKTDIDSSRNVILIRQGKGKKDRYTILSQKAKDLLLKYFCDINLNSDYLFQGRKGKYSYRTVQMIISSTAKKVGIKRTITPHMLRHSFATHLLEDGVDINYIRKLLGHSRISTTQIYAYVAKKDFLKIKSPYD